MPFSPFNPSTRVMALQGRAGGESGTTRHWPGTANSVAGGRKTVKTVKILRGGSRGIFGGGVKLALLRDTFWRGGNFGVLMLAAVEA